MTGTAFLAQEEQVSTEGTWKVTVAVNWTKNKYNDEQAKRDGYVWLQGIGYCKAKPLVEFAVNDLMAWNYGSTSQVVALLRNDSGDVVGVREAFMTANGRIRVLDRKRRGDMLTVVAT